MMILLHLSKTHLLIHQVLCLQKSKGNGSDGKDNGKGQAEKGKSSEEADKALMTDAQKRYLFRLLAEQGIEGDKAYDHLKKLFHMELLQEVTKQEASKAIENLLEGTQKGGRP